MPVSLVALLISLLVLLSSRIFYNVFDVNANLDVSNTNKVTFAGSNRMMCENGLWFRSELVFWGTAYVTDLYSISLYEVEVLIHDSGF